MGEQADGLQPLSLRRTGRFLPKPGNGPFSRLHRALSGTQVSFSGSYVLPGHFRRGACLSGIARRRLSCARRQWR